MDESQEELYRACLVFPARDGRSATPIEQGFIDRMEAKYPVECCRIGEGLIGELQEARRMAIKMKNRIATENKRLAAAEHYAAQREAQRHKAARHNAEVVTRVFSEFVNQVRGAANEPDAKQPATEQAAKPDVVMAGGGGGTVEQASEPDRVFVVGDCVIVGRNVRATGEHAGIVVAVSDDGVVCQYLDASENVDQYNEPPMRLLGNSVTPVEDLGVELELIGNTYGFTAAGESIATHRNGAPRVWSEPWSVRRIGRHGLLKLARQRLQVKEARAETASEVIL